VTRPALLALLLACAGLLAGCGGGRDAGDESAPAAGGVATPADATAPAPTGTVTPAWDLVSSGEGTALVYPAAGDAAVRLFCPAGAQRLLVNVPAFRPVGSEERLSFGSGGNAHALVADTRGDAQRGGVSGTGAVPGNLAALIGGPVSVSYGAQASGPHPAPRADLARAFVGACREGGASSTPTPTPTTTPSPTPSQVSACLMQDDERLTVAPLRAVGTEPFWGARIEGRCVTYSHPENQQGTRVWTRYAPRPGGGGTWTGSLGGKPFVLRTRPQAGCSDGMSDKRYPLAVELTVAGEERRGCVEAG
jgi:uncharacterized membrane protein